MYANPISEMYDDYIDITEYSVDEYDKNNMVPLRFKTNVNELDACSEWQKFDEQNINFDKIRKQMMRENGGFANQINLFPKLKNGKDTEIWSIKNEYKNGNLTRKKLVYGDITEIDESPKLAMTFEREYDDDLEETVWKVKKEDSIPKLWEDIFNEVQAGFFRKKTYYEGYYEWENTFDETPTFKELEFNETSFIKWCAFAEMEPELLEYFKCKKISDSENERLVIVPKDFEFDEKTLDSILSGKNMEDEQVFSASRLALRLDEDENIEIGVLAGGDSKEFISFKDLIAKMKMQSAEISLKSLTTEALDNGITADDVSLAENAENKQVDKGAISK